MSNYQVTPFQNISGGLAEHRVQSPSQMGDNEWAYLRNFEYAFDGSLKSRGGCAAYNGTAISGAVSMENGERYYLAASGTNTLYVAVNGSGAANKIYRGNDGAGTFTEVTSGTALNSGAAINFLVARDTLFAANGFQKIQYCSGGVTKQDIVSTDNYRYGKYLAWADNILWQAGDPSNPNRVWCSADGLYVTSPGTDCSFPAVNFINIPHEQNDIITGLLTHENELLIFRNKDIYILEGAYQDWDLRRIDKVGAYDQRSICSAGKYGIFFVGQEGIFWKPTLNSEPRKISVSVQTTFDENFWQDSAAGFYNNRNLVYFSYSTSDGGTNSKCVVFDAQNERWVGPHDGIVGRASRYLSFSGVDDTGAFYALAPASGMAYLLDTGNQDEGSNFTCEAWTKHYDMNDPVKNKLGRTLILGLRVNAAAAPFTSTVVLDRGRKTLSLPTVTMGGFSKWGSFVWGVDPWGNGQAYSTAKMAFPHGAKGREFQIRISKTDGNPFRIFDMGVEHKEETYRRRME